MIYGGAAPNQHVVPLAGWALPRYGHDVLLRRQQLCVVLGDQRASCANSSRAPAEGCCASAICRSVRPIVDAILREVRDTVPDIVFNTLIGESSYAFYRAYHRLSRQEERFRAERRPIAELHAVRAGGAGDRAGAPPATTSRAASISSRIERPENAAFLRAFRSRFGAHRVTSADAEAAYVTTLLLATSLQAAGTDRVPGRSSARPMTVGSRRPKGPSGSIPRTTIAWLTPRIGRATADGQFRVEWEAAAPCRPDPYLARLDRSLTAAAMAPADRRCGWWAGYESARPRRAPGAGAAPGRPPPGRACGAATPGRPGGVLPAALGAASGQVDADFVFFDADVRA